MNITDDKERKAIPVWDGVVGYFPKALMAIAIVSRIGNDQHNPGEPLHWARGKSMNQVNTAMRHKIDHYCFNTPFDKDGAMHLAKSAWRELAGLELAIEALEEKCVQWWRPEVMAQPTPQAELFKAEDFLFDPTLAPDEVRIDGEVRKLPQDFGYGGDWDGAGEATQRAVNEAARIAVPPYPLANDVENNTATAANIQGPTWVTAIKCIRCGVTKGWRHSPDCPEAY